MSLDRDPFDDKTDIWNECSERSNEDEAPPMHLVDVMKSSKDNENAEFLAKRKAEFNSDDPGAILQRAMESSVLHRMFGDDINRRRMLKGIGSAAVYLSLIHI